MQKIKNSHFSPCKELQFKCIKSWFISRRLKNTCTFNLLFTPLMVAITNTKHQSRWIYLKSTQNLICQLKVCYTYITTVQNKKVLKNKLRIYFFMLSFWVSQQYHVVIMIKILYQNKSKKWNLFTKTFESYQTTIPSWEEYLWHLSTVHNLSQLSRVFI